MALEQSILKGTKKKLGVAEDDDSFDVDIADLINSAFFRLFQLGLGPPDGFAIDDAEDEWDDFNTVNLNVSVLNAVKTYVHLKCRLAFDPPQASHHVAAIQDQITELEHTLRTERDLAVWAPVSSSQLSLP